MHTNRSIENPPVPLSEIAASSWAKRLLIALAGSWVIAASAWIEVPMVPVPMTMQTLAILLIGIACGARLASETVGLYLVQGAVGLPVFAGGANGVQHLWGPTGGYLVGFLFAAALIGLLADRGWSNGIIKPLCALAIGHIAVFIPGTLWLAGFTGFEGAIAAGLTPFIPGTIVKTLLAFALFKGLVTWIYPKAATRI
jgi:biotin transport system substrate-specific component